MDNLEVTSLYKLIILYMLDEIDCSIMRSQVLDFMLDKGYADYFTVQRIIGELIEDKLIESKSIRNASCLLMTRKGRETIVLFKNDLSRQIMEDIDKYLSENEIILRNRASILANYYKSTLGDFVVELIGKERNSELINIKISVPTEKDASCICNNWYEKSQVVYEYLMKTLQ